MDTPNLAAAHQRIRDRIAHHESMAARWRRLLDLLSSPDAPDASTPTPQPRAGPPRDTGTED